MPAMQEISRPQPHVPTTFERLTQGSTARAVQVEAFRQAQLDFAREGLVLVGSPEPLTPEPQSHTPSFVKRFALPTAAALSVISLACSPQAESPSPTSLYPVAVAAGKEPTPILIEPGGAYNEVRESQAAAIANATATAQAKPAETIPSGQGGGKPEVKVPVQEVVTQEQLIAKVDDLISLAQNPDKQIIEQQGLLTNTIEANTQELVDGLKTRIPGESHRGLKDLKAAIAAGNNAEAKAIIKEICNKLLIGQSFRGKDENDLVRLTPEELKQFDPNNDFPRLRLRSTSAGVSVIRKELVVETLTFNGLVSIGK